MGLFFKNEFDARTQKSPVLQAWPDPAGLLDAGEPEDGSEQAQGNESRLTRLWLQWAESVQQVLRVPGGTLAAALD